MIFLKKFDNIESYEAYKNSADFKKPSICYIRSPKGVYFHPKDTFKVTEGAFYVDEGIFEFSDDITTYASTITDEKMINIIDEINKTAE